MRIYTYRGYSYYRYYSGTWFVYSSYKKNKNGELEVAGEVVANFYNGNACKKHIIAIYELKSKCRR